MRNVISGNSSIGIGVVNTVGPGSGNRILGNLIGTDVTGMNPLGNLSAGISVSGVSDTTIGGTNANEPNLIAFNNADGVAVFFFGATNNTVRANSIFDNGHLGIDLGNSGVLQNDAGDPDTGTNLGQNFPVLSNVVFTTSNLVAQGTLNSEPSRTYRLDFYANVICDPTGHGEGKHWLGSAMVMTGTDSNATFSVNLPFAPEGNQITATATDGNGNTSEFSPCQQLVSGIPPLLLTVVNTQDSGPGSLRAALATNNASFSASPNTIRFDIPGTNVQSIALLSPLPPITQPVIIDGFTQPGAMTNAFVNNTNTGVWKIRLDGTSAGTNNVDALHFNSSSNTVRGLVIVNFSGDGIELEGGAGNVIEQNLLGIDVLPPAAGFASRAADGFSPGLEFLFSLQRGVNINGSAQNLIEANFIGLVIYAIYIQEFGSYLNYIAANIFGIGPDFGSFPIKRNGILVKDGFDTIEKAVSFQRHEQEKIYLEQEADPELFDLPFISSDPDLVARVERDAEYRTRLERDLGTEARRRRR